MKIWRIILLVVVSILYGCSEEPESINPGGEGDNDKPTTMLVVDVQSVSFTEEGGMKTVSISSSETWTASVINNRAESWCTIRYSGTPGESELLITATPNETPDERSASIIIKAGTVEKTVIVTQKQKDALTVTSTKFEVGAEGGQITIEVNANVAFEYVIEEFAKDWLYINNTRSMNSSTLVFTVLPNEELTKREGAIVIKSGELKETIVVYQSGVEPSIIISQNKYTISSKGGNISVEVSSNVDVEVQMPEGVSWVYENTTRSMSTNSYTFCVEENISEEKRECTIRFSNIENNITDSVTISQDEYPSIVYDINGADKPLVYNLGINNSVLFYILAGSDYKIESDSEWCRLIKLEIVREDIPYTIELEPNTTGESRTAYITVHNNNTETSETITVIQPSQNEVIYEEGKEQYYVEADECVLTIPIITNMEVSDIKVLIYEGWDTPEWIHFNSKATRAFREDSLEFYIAENDGEQRSARIEIYKSDRESDYDCYTIIVNQRSKKETECRNILRNFYDKMSGDIWLRKDNWFSEDKMVSEWYGVSEIMEELMIDFSEENNLAGEITDESIKGINHIKIQNNKNVKNVHIKSNESVQTLSLESTSTQSVNIEDCPNLTLLSLPASVEDIYVMNCGLSNIGLFYASNENKQAMMLKSLTIGNCSRLRYLDIDGIDGDAPNLQTVDLSGCESLENFLFMGGNLSSLKVDGCVGLKSIYVPSNKLTSINLSSCKGLKSLAINDNTEMTELDLSGLEMLEYLRIGGNVIDIIRDYPSKNLRPSKLRTLKLNGCMALQEISGADYTKDPHGNLYYEHLPSGLETLELNNCTSLKSLNLAFTNIKSVDLSTCTALESIDIDNEAEIVLDLSGCPNIKRITSPGYDCKDGTVVLVSDEYDWSKIEYTYISCPIITKDAYYHTSTDFSQDGKVRIVQTATEGNGIDVVVMGDGFNDKMVSNGMYDAYMDRMIDGLFGYEPYKSFKHLFNIYVVTTVSEKGYVYGKNTGKTALRTYTSNNELEMRADDVIKEYTTKAIDEERLEEAVVIVGINGVGRSNCRMYEPQTENDYGCGFSIALCQAPGDGLEELVAHEAGGHGFAKLADEYIEEYETFAPELYFSNEKYGWHKNVDNTSDLKSIKWADFISDSRYAIENLGAYEGAWYKNGIYRSTEQSMMNNQNEAPYFNAPSRNAIYIRIHKLAYGEDWVYDYETFVEYDSINLTRSRSLLNRKSTNVTPLKDRTAPPQIIRR